MFAIQHGPAGACIEHGQAAPRSAADWLALAAAPTFAIMALLAGLFGGTPDAVCAALQGTSPLSGMVPMYLLMSAFHAAPWMRLVATLSHRYSGGTSARRSTHCGSAASAARRWSP